jgi:dienelactone hydrolase
MARTSGGHTSSQGEEEEHAFPNLFDFSRMGDYMKTLAYDSTLKPKFESLARHLDNCGLEKNAILSFSWGGWVTAHVLSDPALANKYTCAAIAHPSITLEERIFGGNTAELMNKIQKPLLLIPCKGDPDEYRAGGALFEPLKHRLNTSEVLDLPDVEHGFLPRGKVTNQKNFDALHKTMNKVLEFFNNHAN